MSKTLPLVWSSVKRRGVLKDGVILKGVLDEATSISLTATIAERTVLAYVDPAHLAAVASAQKQPLSSVFSALLPTKKHLVSGDFGEIFVSVERQHREPEPVFHLFRWRERATPDDTVRGVDLIGLAKRAKRPLRDDTLVLVEVKTRAKTKKRQIVRDAFRGVTKDYATRLSSSLLFHHLKLQRQGDPQAVAVLERFMGEDATDYQVLLVAAVVHDNAKWDDACFDELPEKHGLDAAVEVQVACVENLSLWIDAVRAEAIRKSGAGGVP